MTPTLLLFILIAAFLVVGAGFMLLSTGATAVDDRLEDFVTAGVDTNVPKERVVVADRVDTLISDRDFSASIKARIIRADAKLRVSEYIVLVILSGVVVGYLFFSLFGPILGVVGFLLGLQIPRLALRAAATRRIQRFNEQLGDTLNLWVNALRSGYSVLQSMETIATELPAPVSTEFERVVQEVRLGLSLRDALLNMLRRVPSEDLDLVVTAVTIQREVGGNLSEILENISFTIRERIRIKGEIRTLTAQGRFSGWIITLLPIVLAAALYAVRPDYVSQLWSYEDPLIFNLIPCGWLVIGVSVIMMILGSALIRHIVDIEV